MKATLRFVGPSCLAVLLALSAGCASSKKADGTASLVTPGLEQQVLNNPASRTRLKSFARAEIKAVTVTPSSANRREDELARRIDKEVQMSLEPLWKKVTLVPRGVPFTSPPPPGTLLIEPTVVETKLTRPLDREFLTWTEGDTYIVIKVSFRDGATGESLAEPLFYRKSALFWASWSGGATDREIEREIARDIVTYVRDNY